MSFTIEAKVTKLHTFEGNRAVPVNLLPGSSVRLEVHAELEGGRLRPVDAVFAAHLMPQAADEAQSGARPGLLAGVDLA